MQDLASNTEGGLAPVIYLGDSHTSYIQRAARNHLFFPRSVTGVEVGGATARGMRNPNALTDAVGRFRRFVQDKPTNSIIVIHLGEVDCGYVFWHRNVYNGEDIRQQIIDSTSAYFGFVDELLGLGFQSIVITGATLPTISDDDIEGEVVQKRSSVKISQRDRTDLTLDTTMHSL